VAPGAISLAPVPPPPAVVYMVSGCDYNALTTEQAAEALNISPLTLQEWKKREDVMIAAGNEPANPLPCFQRGAVVRWPVFALREWERKEIGRRGRIE